MNRQTQQIFPPKWIWITVAVAAAVVLLLVFAGKIKAWLKNTYNQIPGDVKLDDKGNVIEVRNPLSNEEIARARTLAERLKTDIEKWTGAVWRDSQAYYELESSSDKIFVATANAYKQITTRNLFADIQQETSFNPWLVDSTKKIIQRARNLNLM